MKVAAHKGDLLAAKSTGMHTAFVRVPEEDYVDEEFEKSSENGSFDIEADDFGALCKKLQV